MSNSTHTYRLKGTARSTYEDSTDPSMKGKLMLCYESEIADSPESSTLKSQKPAREMRGPAPPPNHFKNAILDVKNIDVPMRMLVSSCRDGEIKLWR